MLGAEMVIIIREWIYIDETVIKEDITRRKITGSDMLE